jgi:hypothetical protein
LGKNTGSGYRKGAQRGTSQAYNGRTKRYVRRGKDGRFTGNKASKYKGVRCKTVN